MAAHKHTAAPGLENVYTETNRAAINMAATAGSDEDGSASMQSVKMTFEDYGFSSPNGEKPDEPEKVTLF